MTKQKLPIAIVAEDHFCRVGGGSLMVWGCMRWNGVGMPAEVKGRMDAE
jgi:hypothetical protein